MRHDVRNPIGPDFRWDELYEEYDAANKRFDPNAPSLFAFPEKLRNDRDLYYLMVDRVWSDVAEAERIELGTYEAILYWKLYSQPAAVKNVCARIRSDPWVQERIVDALGNIGQQLPRTLARDTSPVRGVFELLEQYRLGLYGMATSCALPTRSTLLHLLYPSTIPIFDKQVLRAVGIDEPAANTKHSVLFDYIEFAWETSEIPGLIPQDWKESPLRLLDMALWVLRGNEANWG